MELKIYNAKPIVADDANKVIGKADTIRAFAF